MQKIKVNLDKDSYKRLLLDIETFEILKNDGSINKNKFLNLLFKNYFAKYQENQEKQNNKFRKVLLNYNIKNEEIINSLNNEISFSDSTAYQNASITFILNNENDFLFESILDKLYGISSSSYFRNLILSYLKEPQYIRQTIIFKDKIDIINKAIENKNIVRIQLKNTTFEIKPFVVTSTKEELYSYLLGINNLHIVAINISKILNIILLNDSYILTESELDLLNLNLEKGIQFPFDKICEAKITLSNNGIKLFKKRYLHRPIPDKIVDNTLYFSCSFSQLYFYFIAFANDIISIEPDSLAKKMLSSYKAAYYNLRKSLNNKNESN